MGVQQAHVAAPREKRESISLTSLILVAGLTLVIVAFIIVTTAPLGALLSASSHTPIAAFHGLVATVMFIVTPIGLYLGYQLFQGRLAELRTLKLLSVVTVAICFITIVFGNSTLIGYRVKDGAREWLRANNPAVHGTFFEFKEYLALFTLPLAVLAAYLLYRYADSLSEHRWMRGTIAMLLVLTFLYFAATFILGASIARVKAV